MQKYYIKQKKAITATVIGSFFLLFLFSIAFFFPTADGPGEVSAATGFSNLSSSTLAVATGHDKAAVRLAIRDQNGTFAASTADEEAKFSVSTDNFTGYTVTIKGTDDTKKLSNSLSGGSFDSIDTAISEATFNSATYNGKWGFKPSKYNSSTNTQFRPSPTTTSEMLIDATAVKNDTPNDYTIGIGARADYSTTSGAYSNTFVINVTTNPISYAITYADASGDNSVRNLPPIQSSTTDSANVTLSTQTPYRDGYRFLRWCLGTVENNATTCNGTTFERGGTFGLDQTDENIPTLYAVWSPNIRLRIAEGISNVNISGVFKNEDTGEYENTTKSCNITVDPDASANGCVIEYLEYGSVYEIQATDITDGYRFVNWVSNGYGTLTDATSNPTNFTVGAGNTTISPNTDSNTYVIGLDNHLATVQGSTSAVATYRDTELSEITNPERHYNVSGFDVTHNNATGASVTDAEDNPIPSNYTLTNSYEFAGWYYATNDNRMIITAAGELVASTPYTDALGKWNVTYGATVYAGWGEGTAVRLPKISKTGYTCGWTDSDNNSSILWASGYEGLVPTADMTLYGVCTLNTYNVTVHFASGGVSSVTFAADGQETKTVSTSDGKVRLTHGIEYTVTMNLAENFAFKSWSLNDDSYGNLTSVATNPTTFTPNIHSGSAVITASAIIMGSDFMQNLPYEECTEEPKVLIDSRDGQTYMVQRLKDGNCWMMDNLNLGANDITGDLTSDNTNLADGVEPITAATFNSWRVLGSGNTIPQTYDAGVYVPITTSNSNDHLDTDPVSGTKYGTLYNYYATSAGTIQGSTNATNAASDICPAGWRLPTGGDDSASDFQNLYSYYQTNTEIRAPAAETNGGAAIGLAGMFGTAPTRQGTYGFYWSSTRYNDTNMRNLQINNSDLVNTARYTSRATGYTIRCILSAVGQTIPVTYLQDFNTMSTEDINRAIENMEVGINYSIKDKRDEQIYTISLMKDGNVWMTKNLNLGVTDITAPLTSENTNFVGEITADTFNNNWRSSNYIVLQGSDTVSGTASSMSYGTLYNYYAASAGTITGSYNYNNAQYDICPAGWRLPTGGADSEFSTIFSKYDSSPVLMHEPIAKGGAAFAYSGYQTSSSAAGQNSSGYYWSSSWDNKTNSEMSTMYLTSTEARASSSNRSNKISVRCKLKTIRIGDISTMQQFNSLTPSQKYDVINSMAPSTNYAMQDTRDEQTYTIAKLPDDRVWMTQNLNLGPEIIYTPDFDSTNTNLAQGNALSQNTFNNYQDNNGYLSTNMDGIYVPLSDINTSNGLTGDATSGVEYGTLYNYCAASAGTYCYSSNNGAVTSDICPAGWRLPTASYDDNSNGSSNSTYPSLSPADMYFEYEFYRLSRFYLFKNINTSVYDYYDTTGYKANLQKPIEQHGLAISPNGVFRRGTTANTDQGNYGYYWTSTVYGSSSYIKAMRFNVAGANNTFNASNSNSSVTFGQYSFYRYDGASIRCILK